MYYGTSVFIQVIFMNIQCKCCKLLVDGSKAGAFHHTKWAEQNFQWFFQKLTGHTFSSSGTELGNKMRTPKTKMFCFWKTSTPFGFYFAHLGLWFCTQCLLSTRNKGFVLSSSPASSPPCLHPSLHPRPWFGTLCDISTVPEKRGRERKEGNRPVYCWSPNPRNTFPSPGGLLRDATRIPAPFSTRSSNPVPQGAGNCWFSTLPFPGSQVWRQPCQSQAQTVQLIT